MNQLLGSHTGNTKLLAQTRGEKGKDYVNLLYKVFQKCRTIAQRCCQREFSKHGKNNIFEKMVKLQVIMASIIMGY